MQAAAEISTRATTSSLPEAARVPAGAPPYTIGLPDGEIDSGYRVNWYQTPINDGIFVAARRLHHNVITPYGYRSNEIETSLPAYLRICNGLLHNYGALSPGSYAAIRDAGFPLVTIGGRGPDGRVASIDIDNVTAAREVTEHLITLGHRRIALFMADVNDPTTSALRTEGYRLAHRDAGLPVDESLICPGWSETSSGSERTAQIAAIPAYRRPTAIVCYNDAVALGVLRAAPTLGLPVPAQLSVTGFDDLVEVSMIKPAMPTVLQPLRLIGERALELLVDIIEGRKPANQREVVRHELVVRQSTAPPPRPART
jgi:DNA-binding LacI/PurR family transcriptional regulator